MLEKTDFDRYQEELRKKTWRIEDLLFYEKGKRIDIAQLHKLDYSEFGERTFGRKFGKQGIGRLKEVALTKITEREIYSNHLYFKQDPEFFAITGLGGAEQPDMAKWQKQHENYANVLQENGVKVHWMEYPENFMGPFGPFLTTWALNDTLITRGGSIVQRGGMYMWGSYGRFEYLAKWALTQLNIPILLSITGRGICEAAPVSHFLAEDVMMVGLSAACNQEGLDQLVPAVVRNSGVENFQVIVNRMSLDTYWDNETGICAHLDIVLAPVGLGKVLLYPPAINTEALIWFREHKFEIIEINREEHIRYMPANLILLEPGKVIVHAGADRTISKLRKAGIEVIDIPASEYVKMGGGIHCAAMEIYREPGPFLRDIV